MKIVYIIRHGIVQINKIQEALGKTRASFYVKQNKRAQIIVSAQ